ncbi:MAG: imidazole glycerol phosphate synthase subunit HisF [Firmicutes bacterium]|nr:imidazole glycerol phosphate synthase subunit HisF [Alicyclobacillaceae bacterium]MCL6496589.1 imidazole glycerol phosphate synthase subunit HisF [Bacillota bacterium]
MLLPRIIPCLDVRHGRVVKGIRFLDLKDSGDPVELAAYYASSGADEVVWLDIVATVEDLKLATDLIAQARRKVDVPMTVGGGIRSLDHVEALLEAGADKVSINTYAVQNPAIISEVARRWGSQCMVVAIDARREGDHYQVYTHGGRQRTDWELGAWLKAAEESGAGEFLLTSMDRDGTQAGYDLPMLRFARERVRRPIIASGGAGTVAHLAEALRDGHDALLLASILHQGTLTVPGIKEALRQEGVLVRWPIL